MSVHGWIIRNIQWPIMEKRKGNKIRHFMKQIHTNSSRPSQELENIRKEKLTKLLLHAVRSVPAYQRYQDEVEREVSQPTWDSFHYLQKLPVLTKKDFNASPEEFITRGIDRSSLLPNRTGGSTGEPTRFYLDRATVEHYEAARWVGLSWHGIRIGDPSVMIWGSPIELNQQQSVQYARKERLLKNRKMIPAYDLQEDKLAEYIRMLEAYKPVYLYGYASALALFAQLIRKHRLQPRLKLKAVVSTAESLLSEQRTVIEDVFGCPAVNEYGARDGGMIAYQCTNGYMHMFADHCLVEVVDLRTKEPVPPGKEGLILVTDLNNYSMPRLRYQLNDVVTVSPKACSCGMTYPVLERIEGREDDVFVKPNGEYVHGHYFNHIARNLEGIDRFQIVQHAPDAFTLQLVKHPSTYQPEVAARFIDGIKQSFGEDIHVSVAFTDQIPPTPSGKVRYAIREFPLPYV